MYFHFQSIHPFQQRLIYLPCGQPPVLGTENAEKTVSDVVLPLLELSAYGSTDKQTSNWKAAGALQCNIGPTGHRVGNGQFSEERGGNQEHCQRRVMKGDSCGVIWNLLSGQEGKFEE